MAPIKHARTPILDIAYEDSGPAGGTPVFLMHGFPYDPRSYDQVVPLLTAQGCRTIVPTCAATARHAFSPPARCARASRQRWATT